MFYPFAKDLAHATDRAAVIWEVETALAAVLTEANESEMQVRVSALQTQAREVLRNRSTSSDMLRECYSELRFVSRNGTTSLEATISRLTDPDQRHSLRRDLQPDQSSILETVQLDRGFGDYLAASGRGGR